MSGYWLAMAWLWSDRYSTWGVVAAVNCWWTHEYAFDWYIPCVLFSQCVSAPDGVELLLLGYQTSNLGSFMRKHQLQSHAHIWLAFCPLYMVCCFVAAQTVFFTKHCLKILKLESLTYFRPQAYTVYLSLSNVRQKLRIQKHSTQLKFVCYQFLCACYNTA